MGGNRFEQPCSVCTAHSIPSNLLFPLSGNAVAVTMHVEPLDCCLEGHTASAHTRGSLSLQQEVFRWLITLPGLESVERCCPDGHGAARPGLRNYRLGAGGG